MRRLLTLFTPRPAAPDPQFEALCHGDVPALPREVAVRRDDPALGVFADEVPADRPRKPHDE